MRPHATALLILLASSIARADTPREVFEKRLAPIFRSPTPSSCVQCHLAGVDLKNYIRPSHEETFVVLRDQGLIDLDNPEKSKILQLIQMGAEDKAGAALIHQKNRTAEYEAFAVWIKGSAADPALRNLPATKDAPTTRPVEVIRHARKDRLLDSFTNTIWALRFRCMSCHIEGTPENAKLVAKHGPRVAWFKKDGPAATLDFLLTSRLLDAKDPRQSLLLTKPLAEVEHGGGKKMLVGDQGYRLFMAFLDDYAKIKNDAYRDAASLPVEAIPTVRFGTNIWIKASNTPPAWGDKLMQADIYAKDAAGNWEPRPIATTDRVVWGKGQQWAHTLTLLADPDSARAKAWRTGKVTLPRGTYLVKFFVDGATPEETKRGTPHLEPAGSIEATSAWPEGYGAMTVLDVRTVKKNP